MASTYAHYRFGKEVLARLPEQERALILANPSYYHLGLHGPDVLFYYHALRKNRVNSLGFSLHEVSGQQFFRGMADTLGSFLPAHSDRSNALQQYRAARAYLYGVLCHFALDSCVHPVVSAYEAEYGVPHVGIESEFDRMLLVADGKNPVRTRRTDHILYSPQLAFICSRFYPGISKKDMEGAIRGMQRIELLICAANPLKRGLLYGIMKLCGIYGSYHWHFIPYRPNRSCHESNRLLKQRYNQAVPLACRLITDFSAFENGTHSDAQYCYNFEGVTES